MRRFSLMAIAGLALFAFGATSSAQAVTAPFWSIGGTRLAAGKTHNFDARADPGFILEIPEVGIKIGCSVLQTENGVLLGSAPGQPGKDNEVAVFSSCTTSGNGELCKVNEPIRTAPITSELVEVVKGAQLLEEFTPTTGTRLATLTFKGEKCLDTEAIVTGSVAAEVLSEAGEKIELGQAAKEATSWVLKFPETPISEVLLINTKGEDTVAKLKLIAFGDAAILQGISLTLLVNTKFEPEPATLWSPLP
jgi:hypothetical protein